MLNALSKLWERGLWQSRIVVLIAVVASVIMAVGTVFFVSVDVVYALGKIWSYANPALTDSARNALRLDVLGDIVGIVDGYLLGAILVIFGLGLYELFIGNIAGVEQSPVAPRLLQVRSIDDLKDKLGRVVLLILVVKFFQQALELKYQSPLDLMYLALGTLLVGAALYLTTAGQRLHTSKTEAE
jgi:uncharacterized membrane protein YqhA